MISLADYLLTASVQRTVLKDRVKNQYGVQYNIVKLKNKIKLKKKNQYGFCPMVLNERKCLRG